MTKSELLVRLQELQEKYQPLLHLYAHWLEVVHAQTRARGHKTLEARNRLPVYHKGSGIQAGLEMLAWNLGRASRRSANEVIELLTQQAHEPSCPPEFRAGVQMVLDDVLAEQVQPLQAVLEGMEEVPTGASSLRLNGEDL